ncbi:MAG: extracellular solute-binding protein [Clostridia bacterium]|nr:extracellular solute-binding protein [Clostridia bacterium]
MKKILSLLLALLMVGALVTAQAEPMSWWDQFLNLQETHENVIWKPFTEETGIEVEYQNYDAASFKEAFDLAMGTDQGPSVMSYAWGGNEAVAKYNNGYFSPLSVNKEDLPDYVQATLAEGYTMFDGQVYSFPTFAHNHYDLFWYNKEKVSEVPQTLAEMRELLKSLTNAENNVYGIALPLTDTGRMNGIINYLAEMSGGVYDIDYATGQYVFNDDITKAVFKFFVDIWEDGSVHPASTTLKTRTVRERWANDEAVFAIDGCWYPGSIKNAFGAEYLDKLGVAAAPVVGETRNPVCTAPSTGTFYLSSFCKDTEAGTNLMLRLLSDEYAIALAEAMDQPPLNTAALEKAENVAEVYVEGCKIMASQMGYRPEPQVRNSAVGDVYTELMTISPNVGDIYVGYITGAITDWETALDEYTAAMNAELDRAIETCRSMGSNVSRDDFIFSNYVRGEDYTSDKYAELK